MFHAICNIKEKFGVTKKIPGGGGGGVLKFFFFFLAKLLSHFTFYAIFNITKILKNAPSLTG